MAHEGGGPAMNPFQDPNFLERLNQDPRTKELMKDPEFVKTLEELSTNPKDLGYVSVP